MLDNHNGKTCETCIHQRVCIHEAEFHEYEKALNDLPDPMGLDIRVTMTCPEYIVRKTTFNRAVTPMMTSVLASNYDTSH